MEMMQTKLRSQ